MPAGFLCEGAKSADLLSFLRTLEDTRHTKPQAAFFSVLKNATTPELKKPLRLNRIPVSIAGVIHIIDFSQHAQQVLVAPVAARVLKAATAMCPSVG
ncbi:Hypothetical protein CulFRC58_2034 [Corynebacterium ulcerans FRC58]|uniref:Uncharacterized protein n=1 Tax=Corynebacterium ulcerans FRC58 TaxID=1408268 RepID=A0ABN4H2V2_CORUL|nr:Hypothetical protein CulFRC58_2034 [Corynebacterium ulcerans FRC58]